MRFMTMMVLLVATSTSSALASAFSYSDLEDLIRTKNLLTIDAVMANLPDTFKKNYVLIYQSRSRQAANVSPLWPRIVLYDSDSKFLMALTKNPNTEPAIVLEDALETIQFNAATRRFELRKLVFDGQINPLAAPVAVNPPECTGCHKLDPRPNWDPYNTWPGVYGSVDRGSCSTMQAGTVELHNYLSFMADHRYKDRYQYLPDEVPPANCPRDPNFEFTVTNGASDTPAGRLDDVIFNGNAPRIQRIIEESASFSTYQYLWTALSKGCLVQKGGVHVEDYFPTGYALAHNLQSFDQVLAEATASTKTEYRRRLSLFMRNNRGSSIEPERVPINFLDPDDPKGLVRAQREAALLKVIAIRAGIDVADWTPMLEPGSFMPPTSSYFTERIWTAWPYIQTTGLMTDSCDELKVKSIAAIGRL